MTRERVSDIIVSGKRVPVYMENNQMTVPSNFEREIVLDFVGRALATPVTGLTIVCGGAIRDIVITYESVVEDIKTARYEIKVQGELDRMTSVASLVLKL